MIWKVIGADVVAGYQRDALGQWVLVGLVIYAPTTDKVRGMRLRRLERTRWFPISRSFEQDAPPSREQVASAWARGAAAVDMPPDREDRWLAAAIKSATRPENLKRRESDTPDDFYRRIAEAHALLSRATNRPTVELAKRAGVPAGTAAAWVSRAKARGMYPSGVSHSIDEQGQPHRG